MQAEDGIRDRNVTGVQTCALPILAHADSLLAAMIPETSSRERELLEEINAQYVKADVLAMHYQKRSERLFRLFALMTFARSEERRVGKDGRPRRGLCRLRIEALTE